MSGKNIHFRRFVIEEDLDTVRKLCTSTGNFSPEEIELARDLVRERLDRDLTSGYHFIFAQNDKAVAGYVCYGPIPCTKEGWDVYWIAVDPVFQGTGVGRKLLTAAEARIREGGGGRIYIETSFRPSYRKSRAFYQTLGYRIEACLPDFYAPEDDKIIYLKVLDGQEGARDSGLRSLH